jgi:hypothetical protein
MSDFADLVKKINDISNDTNDKKEVITEGTTLYTQTAEESITGSKETLSLLKVIDDINGEKVQESEDIADDIRSRFSDFMKSEVQQGNDLNSVDIAVKEATDTAMAITDSFDKMFGMMNRLLKVTSEGGVLAGMVEREGGDVAWISDANQKLIEAMEALEEAHMYSVMSADPDR